MSIADLIKRSARGERGAQKQLFELLSPRAMMLCMRYIKNDADAEDIVQESCVQFFSKLNGLRLTYEEELYAYFKKIVVNKCLLHLRKTQAFIMVAEGEAGALTFDETEFEKLQYSELYSMILGLSVGYRTVFNLYEIEGYEHKEIATMLGIRESASRSSLSRAKQSLQKMLTAQKKHHEKEHSK